MTEWQNLYPCREIMVLGMGLRNGMSVINQRHFRGLRPFDSKRRGLSIKQMFINS
jgi:hypothetical protein